MKVTLISHTPDALNLLLRTKGTRLAHQSDPSTWTDEQRQEHLDYMRDTIRSSWEFVDYTFEINDVTRVFTHQLVRTRTGSYAQEAQRVVDASQNGILMPEPFADDDAMMKEWDSASARSIEAYLNLCDMGAARQDARGILPNNILTNIICKFNLRTLSAMAELRLCTRTQGEYQNVFRAMRAAVIAVHPWAEPFLQVACAANGRCAFPRYGKQECGVYKFAKDVITLASSSNPSISDPQDLNDGLKIAFKAGFDSAARQEANPIAKNGKAM
jgi:flavin-dependent thymidylate synthase